MVIQNNTCVLDSVVIVIFTSLCFIKKSNIFYYFLGTRKERGLTAWKKQLDTSRDEADEKHSKTYDIPLITKYIRKVACFRFIPVCPSFAGCRKEKETGDIELRVTTIEADPDRV